MVGNSRKIQDSPLRLGFVVKEDLAGAVLWSDFVRKLKKNSSFEFALEKSCYSKMPRALRKRFRPMNLPVLCEKSDVLISVGGDGTLLRCARFLLKSRSWHRTPILGVNAGHLGFLASLQLSELSSYLNRISRSQSLDRRACLRVQVIRKKKTLKEFHVLNDVVLSKGSLSRIFGLSVEVNDKFLSSYRADGLIVATPTGSTAYNLAAGGSIMEPTVSSIQLTPICAQSFSNKPIVISDKNVVTLRLGKHSMDIYLTLDGQTGVKVLSTDEIRIEKSNRSILFLQATPGKGGYFQALRQKLKWGLVSP